MFTLQNSAEENINFIYNYALKNNYGAILFCVEGNPKHIITANLFIDKDNMPPISDFSLYTVPYVLFINGKIVSYKDVEKFQDSDISSALCYEFKPDWLKNEKI